MSEESLVTVGSFPDAAIAYLAKGRLEEAGIACYIAEENSAGWVLGIPTSWPKLQVAESDALRAIAVLESEFGSEPGEQGEQGPEEGITTRDHVYSPAKREVEAPEPDFGPEEEEEQERTAEKVDLEDRTASADRAFKSAIGGIIFPPLLIYTFLLLIDVWLKRGPLTDRARWRAWVAAGTCMAVSLLYGFFFLLWYG